MYPNPLKQKIQDGKLVLGTAIPTHDIRIAAALAYDSTADFIWIDQEHSPFGPRDMEMIPIILRQQGIAPMVRVPWNDPTHIKKAFDAGASAVMVPQISNVEEAKRAIDYAKYPPLGNRGISPTWPALAGESFIDVINSANDETVLILQLESEEHYKQVDDILALDGFDVLLVGPMDLSASLGVTTDMQNSKVQSIMEEMPKRAEGSGKIIGTTLGDPEEIRQKVDWGYKFLNLGSPLGFGISFVNDRFVEYREQAGN